MLSRLGGGLMRLGAYHWWDSKSLSITFMADYLSVERPLTLPRDGDTPFCICCSADRLAMVVG